MQNDSNLRKVQNAELDILKEFIEICRKINVRYYVIDGTLLGAVRHQGFIPWDDDIDIGMFREDYEKFVALAPQVLPECLFLQTYRTDEEYYRNSGKIRNSNTTMIETVVKDLRMNHGVFIDIFPLDNYPTNMTAVIWYIKH